MTTLHSAEALHALAVRILTAAGWSDADAADCADHLVLANLTGHDSHGIGMLPAYITSWADGWLKPSNQPTLRTQAPPFLTIDAHLALGQPAAKAATVAAIDMTRSGGVSILNLVNAHHVGRLGHYAEMVAAAGLIGLFWVNVAGRAAIVAPFGGKAAAFGTNPQAIGIPNGDQPIILDFATSRMAHGKARVAFNKGEPVPEGYIIDKDGNPTTDPAWVQRHAGAIGALLPFGDHKGAGISLIAEIFAAALPDQAAMIHTSAHRSWIINSLFAIVFDPGRIDPDGPARAARIASLVAYQRATPAAASADRVRAPGDKERETRAIRARDGIAVDPETWRQLMAAAEKVGVNGSLNLP